MALRLLMMGTGTFALPTFRALVRSEHDVAALVTQPDRTGRGHHHHPHPMKEAAVATGIPVLQPENVNTPTALDELRHLDADLFVVAAYGQLLSAELLAIPRLGAVNVHASLLPKYRGAAPVQYAIWKGETETGITLFQIQPKLDAGPILGTVATPIGEQETAGELHDRLAELAVPLTLDVLRQLENGDLAGCPQQAEFVTKAPRIRKEQGLIDWAGTSTEIGWHLRAMQPWPMPYSFLHLADGQVLRVLILSAEPFAQISDSQLAASVPGQLISGDHEHLLVRTGDGALNVLLLQPAGKRAMSAADFLHGHSVVRAAFRNA